MDRRRRPEPVGGGRRRLGRPDGGGKGRTSDGARWKATIRSTPTKSPTEHPAAGPRVRAHRHRTARSAGVRSVREDPAIPSVGRGTCFADYCSGPDACRCRSSMRAVGATGAASGQSPDVTAISERPDGRAVRGSPDRLDLRGHARLESTPREPRSRRGCSVDPCTGCRSTPADVMVHRPRVDDVAACTAESRARDHRHPSRPPRTCPLRLRAEQRHLGQIDDGALDLVRPVSSRAPHHLRRLRGTPRRPRRALADRWRIASVAITT